jgi:hypothetical protein
MMKSKNIRWISRVVRMDKKYIVLVLNMEERVNYEDPSWY